MLLPEVLPCKAEVTLAATKAVVGSLCWPRNSRTMASHEELIAELVKLEKLSHAARLKHAKKRRLKQLKKYQEWVRYDRQTSATVARKRTPAAIDFENAAVLNDLVSRDDRIGGKQTGMPHYCCYALAWF